MTPTPDTLTRRLRDDARLLMQGEIGMALGLRYHEDTLKQAAEAIESQAAALTAERARADKAERLLEPWRNLGKSVEAEQAQLTAYAHEHGIPLPENRDGETWPHNWKTLANALLARAERAEQERDEMRAQLTACETRT